MNLSFIISLSFLLILIGNVRGDGGIGLYYIGTSRGVITAVKSGSGYKLKEMPFTANMSTQLFAINNDLFIRSNLGSNLVWDISGDVFTPGTPIALYKSKQGTSESTKNEQWKITPGYNKIVSNYKNDMVANVTENGDLVLAAATSVATLSSYQRMYILDFPTFDDFQIDNKYNTSISVYTNTKVGIWNQTVAKNQLVSQSIYRGTVVTIKDSNNVEILPSPYIVNGYQSSYVRIPPIAPLPVGESIWSGYYQVNATNIISISFRIVFNDTDLSGSGTDSVVGDFIISGGYTDGGKFQLFSNFQTTSAGQFYGFINGDSNHMDGTYTFQQYSNVYMTVAKNNKK